MTVKSLRQTRAPRSRRVAGIGLIEVLIAILVLAIGLLGMMGLQVTAKQANVDALQRSVATQLVDDVINRMRLNGSDAGSSDGLMNYHDTVVDSESATLGGTTVTGVTDCRTTDCTPGQIALFDIEQWQQEVAGASLTNAGGDNIGGLQDPIGCIDVVNQGGVQTGFVSVVLAWRGSVSQSKEQLAPLINACVDEKYDDDENASLSFAQGVVVSTFIVGAGG